MKRITICISLLLFSMLVFANKSLERRIYYLDCSYSMVSPNKIWEGVCENLIKAIDNVEDENTELYVIPFAIDGAHHKQLNAFCEKASQNGKEYLKRQIRSIKPSTHSMTYHSDPIKDFYNNNRVIDGGITYMFLMTDGQNEESPDLFMPELRRWGSKFGSKEVYGFYVMLNDAAKNIAVEKIIEGEKHLWKVNTADVDINLIRIQNECIYNKRTDKYVDIPFSGQLKNIKLEIAIENNYYKIVKQEQFSDFIRLYIENDPNYTDSNLPDNYEMICAIKSKGCGAFDFVVTDRIVIQCLNKKIKGIRPTFNKGKNIEKLGSVEFYPKFLWCEEKLITLTDTLFLNFNNDAKENQGKAEFRFVDNDGSSFSHDDLKVLINGVDSKVISVSAKDSFVVMTFSFHPTSKEGKYQGYLKLVNHNLEQDGHTILEGNKENNSLKWQIHYNKLMNPLAKLLMWIGIVILSILFIWFILVKPIVYPTFKKFRKNIIIEKSQQIVSQCKVDFTGARKVVFSNKKIKQSFFNKIFCGKIVTYVNIDFDTPVTFTPTSNRMAANAVGRIYNIIPNPIQRSGNATITNAHKNIKITIN